MENNKTKSTEKNLKVYLFLIKRFILFLSFPLVGNPSLAALTEVRKENVMKKDSGRSGMTSLICSHCANRLPAFLFSIICFSFLMSYESSFADTKPISKGTQFPNLFLKDSLSREEQAYLGMSQKNSFSFKKTPGTLFLFEIFSTYCTSCPKNVPILNNVYFRIENDVKLKGKVKVIGIAVGNNRKEIESFKKEYKILYPVFTDFNFTVHKALGNPRVPYTIFVTRDTKGKGIVVSTHQGVIEPADSVMNSIRDFLQCDPSAPACKFKGSN